MGLNYYASAPTLVLPPTQAQQFFGHHVNTGHHSSFSKPSRRVKHNHAPKFPTPPSLNYQANSHKAAGRKRSIDDVDPEESSLDGSVIAAPPSKPKVEPIYGPGMTLIYPDQQHLNISAESQTGTWAEDDFERKKQVSIRPIAARKLQRLVNRDHPSSLSVQPAVKPPPVDAIQKAHKAQREDVIDEAGHTVTDLAMLLGVGWKPVLGNDALRSAARGWERFIQRNYQELQLQQVKIMLQSSSDALQGCYLVAALSRSSLVAGSATDAQPSFWIFSENLRECKFLGNDLAGAVNSLQTNDLPSVPAIQAGQPAPEGQSKAAQAEADMEVDPSYSSNGVASSSAPLLSDMEL